MIYKERRQRHGLSNTVHVLDTTDGEMTHFILDEYYFRKLNSHSIVDTNSSPFFLHLSELFCRLWIYIPLLGIKVVARKPEVRAWVWKRGFIESSLRDSTGKAF